MTKTSVLILDNIRSVENTASIFRTADGLGVSKVYLIGTTPAPIDRFGRKRNDFTKVALGAEETVPWEHSNDISNVIDDLRSQGFEIISLEQTDESVDIGTHKPSAQFVLVVGNEVEGVSEAALRASDAKVEIEMKGKKESLNVSVSTGIALYELMNA